MSQNEVFAKIPGWSKYAQAKWGFRNHWYPILFSPEISEGQTATAQIMGYDLILKRIDGQVHALRDRCIHRGVQFTQKLECYSKTTLTCWYHGYTYDFRTGGLVNIMASPNSKLIGRARVKRFPVQEAQGMIFVFVGDDNREPPPLCADVPLGFLDPDRIVLGRSSIVNSNWRLGCENGFDDLHIFIHKDSTLRRYRDMSFPLGHSYTNSKFDWIEKEDGPKGVLNDYADHEAVWEGKLDGKVVVQGVRSTTSQQISAAARAYMWLPCVLQVDTFPANHLTQYEWYVPLDDKRHLYMQAIAGIARTDEEKQRFTQEYENIWKQVSLIDFNGDDVWAREATEKFYADDWGWLMETPCEGDEPLIEWRKLASKHNRGIHVPELLR